MHQYINVSEHADAQNNTYIHSNFTVYPDGTHTQ